MPHYYLTGLCHLDNFLVFGLVSKIVLVTTVYFWVNVHL